MNSGSVACFTGDTLVAAPLDTRLLAHLLTHLKMNAPMTRTNPQHREHEDSVGLELG